MKATVSWLGVLLLAGAAVPAVHAQPNPYCNRPAPDACGPGFYCQGPGPCGAVYGPNYCVRPGFEPFQGYLPPAQHQMHGWPGMQAAQGPLASPVFPTHPYARGPRDYFMLEESDLTARLQFPVTSPTSVFPTAAPPPAPLPPATPPAAPPVVPPAGEVPREAPR
jgi:hypothetical protein